MQTLHFTTTINAPVATVRDTMLNHPTYEQWTTAFSAGSTYDGSRDQGSDIRFLDPAGQGMIAQIMSNRLHEYISIKHMGEIGTNNKLTIYANPQSFENYTFTATDANTTKVDVELTAMPDERVAMFNEMRPKALQILKDLCESS